MGYQGQGANVSTKRLRRRAHRPEPKRDGERLSLAPLSFEEALKGALSTKPKKSVDRGERQEKDA